MKKIRIAALLLSIGLLTSCRLMDELGFDTYDYMHEEIITTHAADSETAETLEDLLEVLITDSPVLEPFENMNEAIKEYRDAVLTHMLDTGYSKYSGNIALLEKAERAYPEYTITQIIPESDFEATMYRCFGGDVKITHRDGDRFRYLEKVGAYIAMVMPTDSGLHANVTALSETEQTYRVFFRIRAEETPEQPETDVSEEYFALIIKREDGTLYIKKLLEGSAVERS